jgi:hypothetical protein
MPHEGEGPKFKDALDDAWTKVPGSDKGEWHEVVEIYVKGNNPINQYRVVIDKKG